MITMCPLHAHFYASNRCRFYWQAQHSCTKRGVNMLVSWDADQQVTAAMITCYKVKVPCPVPDIVRRIKTHCKWDHKCCIGSIHEQHIQSPKPIQLAGWAQDWKPISPEETPETIHRCLFTAGAMLSCPKQCACQTELACQTRGCLLKCSALSL